MLSSRWIALLLLAFAPPPALGAEPAVPTGKELRGTVAADPDKAPPRAADGALAQQKAPSAASARKAATEEAAADKSSTAKGSAAAKEEAKVDTWNIFGVTQGSDVGEKGESSIDIEAGRGWSRRGRSFAGLRSTIQYAYGAADRLNLAGTLNADSELQRGPSVRAGEPGAATSNLGLSGTAKYQLLKRGESPIGISIDVTPYALRGSETERARTSTAGAELRLAADAALIPNRLYAAVNLTYGAEKTTAQPWREPDRASQVGASAAMTYAVVKNVFVGSELRYLASYAGLGLDTMNGWAVFLGPTLYLSLGQGYLGATWGVQVAGRAAGERGAKLDLTNFERHQFLLKTGFSF
jgi:hypothetical protein